MQNDVMDIEFDPAKAFSNLKKHKVIFAHAEQALGDRMAVTMERFDAEGERHIITLGMDTLGRILLIVQTPRGDCIRLISARKASRPEAEQYHA
jgi:uncharacterized protein